MTTTREPLLACIVKVPAPVCCTDREDRIVAVNDEWLDFLAYQRDDVIGQPIGRFMTSESARHYEQALASTLAAGQVLHNVEVTFLTKAGEPRDVLFSAQPGDESEPVTVSTMVDLMALRRAERELIRTDERFHLLVAGIADYALYMLSPEGLIASWNLGAERMKGYTSEDVIGKHYSMVYTVQDQQAGLPYKALEEARTQGRYEAQGWRVRKDGSRFWANVVLDAIRDESGNLLGFVKISRDVTEQLQQQQALEEARGQLAQAQKMEAVGQLTGGIAHDFNNLLTAILGNAEMLDRTQGVLTTEARARLATIRETAERGAALTHRLLTFARKQALQPRDTDLNKLVTGMTELIQRTLPESIALETVLGAGLWRTNVDQNQLENVLLNLVVNARDAMPAGGWLTIETANTYIDDEYARLNEVKAGQYVLLAITDSGSGMPPDVMARAFEPFYTTKPEGQGTGLGLSQAFGFVKQSDGHIKLYSEIGQGTTIKIYLPRHLASQDAVVEAQQPIASSTGQYETILVVEDDPRVLEYSCSALKTLGYRALQAETADAALRILEGDPSVSVLFTDVGLPGMNGRELAKEAQRRKSGLKVLFTTGYARNAVVHQGLLDVGAELLPKPFTVASLARKLRQILGNDGRHPASLASKSTSSG